jgi:cytochrome c oxidase assembly protein subunit 15
MAWWLFMCCVLVFAMVVLGGVTRLTGSGLSMVRWEPISGVLPPLSLKAWEEEFAHYRRSPEYQKINRGMSLDEFKRIFYYEYSHRVLGRAIGIAFLIPFLYFLIRGRVRGRLAGRLGVIFLLGGAQGLLGWYMVASGLVDRPHVSQYRLTAHLALAVLIYVAMLWTALGLLMKPADADRSSRHTAPALMLTLLVFLTLLSGGFVAGLKAGLAYNTFPLMGGEWIPSLAYANPDWSVNLFEDVTTVQFNHRVLAVMTLLTVIGVWLALWRRPLPRIPMRWLHVSLAAAVLQVALGISTLLLHVPTALAAAHQAGALVLITALVGLARAR